MGVNNNCFTHALGVEETPDFVRLLRNGNARVIIPEVLGNLGFDCREVSMNSPLYEGEWRIFFAGLYRTVYSFFGFQCEKDDYHFARQGEDGKWSQRDVNCPVVDCDILGIIESCIEEEIPYYFFAVKKRV